MGLYCPTGGHIYTMGLPLGPISCLAVRPSQHRATLVLSVFLSPCGSFGVLHPEFPRRFSPKTSWGHS